MPDTSVTLYQKPAQLEKKLRNKKSDIILKAQLINKRIHLALFLKYQIVQLIRAKLVNGF